MASGLAKTVVTGSVYRAPEKRFTQNNIPVSSFVLNIGEREEMLVRVIARRTSLDEIVSTLSQGDRVLIDGYLQITSVKSDNGSERRIFEIDANSVELIGGSNSSLSGSSASSAGSDDVVKFDQDAFSNELIGEEEIPF